MRFALLLALCGLVAISQAAENGTIWDVASTKAEFSTFVKYISQNMADLKNDLGNSSKQFTLFLPNNNAVKYSKAGITNASVVKYHVSSGARTLDSFVGYSIVPSILDSSITKDVNLGAYNYQVHRVYDYEIVVGEDGVDLYRVNLTAPGYEPLVCSNGVLYFIDKVLYFPPADVVSMVRNTFSKLGTKQIMTQLDKEGLSASLAGYAGVTLFAPLDAGFVKRADVVARLSQDKKMKLVLENHAIAGVHSLDELMQLGSVTTLAGSTLTFGLDAYGHETVNGINISITDALAKNGRVFTLADDLLFPTPNASTSIKDALDLSADAGRFVTVLRGQYANVYAAVTQDTDVGFAVPTDDGLAVAGAAWNPANVDATTHQITYMQFDSTSFDPSSLKAVGDSAVIHTALNASDVVQLGGSPQVIIAAKTAAVNTRFGMSAGYTFNGLPVVRGDTVKTGALYIVDGLLVVPQGAAAVVAGNPALARLLQAVNATPEVLQAIANSTHVTVFAPTNAAFDKAALKAEEVADVLKRHVVSTQALYSAALKGQTTLTTIGGVELAVTSCGGSLCLNGAKVAIADVLLSNGVAHVMQDVIPASPPSDDDDDSGLKWWGWLLIILAILIVVGLGGYMFMQRRKAQSEGGDLPYTAA